MDETVNGWTQEEARTTHVEPPECVHCGQDTDDPDIETETLSTGEVICKTDLEDLREFGRFTLVDIIVSSGLGPSTRRILLDNWQQTQAELNRVFEDDPDLFPLPNRISNATQYEQDDTPDGYAGGE